MKSHAFDRGVVYCYNNLFKYKTEQTKDYLLVHQIKRDTVFLLNPDYDYTKISQRNNVLVYCESAIADAKIINETCYNLEELFSNPDKQTRRGTVFFNRDGVLLSETELTVGDRLNVYTAWKDYKYTKVFRIAFNPERYLRSYRLNEVKDLNIYERIIYVEKQPYAVINFSLDGDVAFEISFVSKFFDKQLRFINDLNECILIGCFYDLYKQFGIKIINVGPDAGIKGLKEFKNKINCFYNPIWSITLRNNQPTLL